MRKPGKADSRISNEKSFGKLFENTKKTQKMEMEVRTFVLFLYCDYNFLKPVLSSDGPDGDIR